MKSEPSRRAGYARRHRVVENTVDVPAPTAAVWERVIHPDGFNDEMWPWLTMRMPRAATGMTLETLDLDRPVGRAWLRLFGILPVDFDHLTIVELQPGVRFLERSTMLSMRCWEHERTLTPIPIGTRVCDRVTVPPRMAYQRLGRTIDVDGRPLLSTSAASATRALHEPLMRPTLKDAASAA